jgi:hypothetical protein
MHRELQCGSPSQAMDCWGQEETINSEHYLIMLHNTFVPHLPFTGLLLHRGSCRTEPDCSQPMLFWTSCMTLSTHMASQTDFLIVSHVDRTGP